MSDRFMLRCIWIIVVGDFLAKVLHSFGVDKWLHSIGLWP